MDYKNGMHFNRPLILVMQRPLGNHGRSDTLFFPVHIFDIFYLERGYTQSIQFVDPSNGHFEHSRTAQHHDHQKSHRGPPPTSHYPSRMPTPVYDRTRLNTAVVSVYRRILTAYLAQYYDRISPCRLRMDTTIFGYKRSLFLKHHCTRSPCSLSEIGRIRSETTSYSLSNGSYTIMNDRIRHEELRS